MVKYDRKHSIKLNWNDVTSTLDRYAVLNKLLIERIKFMFTDGRSKKVVFIAHCFLNQNAISDGTAVYPAAFKKVIEVFLNLDIGIIQLPCPELSCLGLDRGNIHGVDCPVIVENTRIRKEMQKTDVNILFTNLINQVMQQVLEYHKYGFEIIGIIGANRSPNCGVDTTSDNNLEIKGKGLFMEELSKRLSLEHLSIPMMGLKSTDDVVANIKTLL